MASCWEILISQIKQPLGTTGALVMDGSANMSGTFTQENGRPDHSGPPGYPCFNVSEYCKYSLVSGRQFRSDTAHPHFTQDDWENRTFSFVRSC